MNAPDTNRSILRHHMHTVEARLPIKFIGVLPRGAAAHVFDENALDLLAKKGERLSSFGISQAEIELGDLIGRPVGIVMVSELRDREAEELLKLADPV